MLCHQFSVVVVVAVVVLVVLDIDPIQVQMMPYEVIIDIEWIIDLMLI